MNKHRRKVWTAWAFSQVAHLLTSPPGTVPSLGPDLNRIFNVSSPSSHHVGGVGRPHPRSHCTPCRRPAFRTLGWTRHSLCAASPRVSPILALPTLVIPGGESPDSRARAFCHHSVPSRAGTRGTWVGWLRSTSVLSRLPSGSQVGPHRGSPHPRRGRAASSLESCRPGFTQRHHAWAVAPTPGAAASSLQLRDTALRFPEMGNVKCSRLAKSLVSLLLI